MFEFDAKTKALPDSLSIPFKDDLETNLQGFFKNKKRRQIRSGFWQNELKVPDRDSDIQGTGSYV